MAHAPNTAPLAGLAGHVLLAAAGATKHRIDTRDDGKTCVSTPSATIYIHKCEAPVALTQLSHWREFCHPSS
eukprot:scaffold7597_cov132-Isochrysis_galbana.AAC.5